MGRPIKTNAARFLDSHGIVYTVQTYEVDESDLSAVHAAQCLGLDAWTVFKTLVIKGDRGGPIVCVIPGPAEIDLKKAAKASGNRKCAMVAVKDLTGLTGYVRGGCSPFAMKRKFPTYFDKTAEHLPQIAVSAGLRGVQILADPTDLIMAAEAETADLID